MESIIKGSYPIQNDEGVLIRNKLELVEFLEKENALTNEILSSIIIVKKSFVNYMINQNQGQPLQPGNNFANLSKIEKKNIKKKKKKKKIEKKK